MANQFMTISLHVSHNEISSTPVKEIYVYIVLCSYLFGVCTICKRLQVVNYTCTGN